LVQIIGEIAEDDPREYDANSLLPSSKALDAIWREVYAALISLSSLHRVSMCGFFGIAEDTENLHVGLVRRCCNSIWRFARAICRLQSARRDRESEHDEFSSDSIDLPCRFDH
jgi:hypothetical protein